MAVLNLNDGKTLGNGRPYIVAEMNSSHNGNLEAAMKMIDAAKECGCDCVKFQSWSEETLYSKEYYAENPITERFVKNFSLDEEKLRALAEYCQKKGISFSSTPYAESETDFLAKQADVPFIKVSSMEINNIPFLQYIAKKDLPIVLSTGMATYDEIRRAVTTIEMCGNEKICILHCVSVYPAEPKIINLNSIKALQEMFPQHPIGYSDHTMGAEVAAASVAMGAVLIEKHFTLDNQKMGMDNNMATEPAEMRELVTACRNVYMALGEKERRLTEAELNQKKKMRRSVVASRNIKTEEILTGDMLAALRPGTGIPPDQADMLIGKKVLRDIGEGYQIRMEDVV